MNRLVPWVLAGVAWWTAAVLSAFVLHWAWVAVTSDLVMLLPSAALLPVAVFAVVAANSVTRDAEEAL